MKNKRKPTIEQVMKKRHGEPFTLEALKDFMEVMGMGPLVFKPGMNPDDFVKGMNEIIDEFNKDN